MIRHFALIGLGASLHLLLPLVINNSYAFHLTHLSENELMEKLTEKDAKTGTEVVALEPDVVFKYIDHVQHKAQVKIGATNLKELHMMNHVKWEDCLDDSFEKRLEICRDAGEAGLRNIDTYCQSRVGKLANVCVDNVESLITGALMYMGTQTMSFFREFMKNHFEDGSDKYESIIDNYVSENDLKRDRLREYCQIMIDDLRNLESAIDYANDHNSGKTIKMSEKAAGWTNVYKLCRYFLKTVSSTGRVELLAN